jgi:hypothetical protein
LKAPIRLPDTVWQLSTGAHPTHKLSPARTLQDLYVWNRYEIGATLLLPTLIKLVGPLPLSEPARQGLDVFLRLYPEWFRLHPYMSIPLPERERRLGMIYGDLPLALEPFLDEIPLNLSRLIKREQLMGRMPIVRGPKMDLWVLKAPHPQILPLSMFKELLLAYADKWHETLSPPARKPTLKLSGKGSFSARLRYQLAMLGRYRLFQANDFDIYRTVIAASAKDEIIKKDLFYTARKFIDRLFPHRWIEAEAAFQSLAYGVTTK